MGHQIMSIQIGRATGKQPFGQNRTIRWVAAIFVLLGSALPYDGHAQVTYQGLGGAVDDSTSSGDETIDETIEEIIVTGSNVRGALVASPLTVLDSQYIRASGFSSVEELIDTLPQNFGGGASIDTISSPDQQSGLNVGAGSSVNLRGLGSGSTLVLLNGHRLAVSGSNGGFVDISLIPLGAIERVEVLTDGASVTYGADAVAGVVNFITHSDFSGADTLIRYGSVTDGALDEIRFAQSLGKNWDSANLFASYEFYDRDNLGVEDRNFGALFPDADLSPKQRRHSIFVSGKQELSPHTEWFGNLLYATREIEIRDNFFLPQFRTSETDQLSALLELSRRLTDNWWLDISSAYSRTELDTEIQISFPAVAEGTSDLLTLDASANGNLFNIAGGSVALAAGLQYREESFRYEVTSSGRVNVDSDRGILAAHAELSIPLVSQSNASKGVYSLDLSVAGRYEDYSDFGSTLEPKVGLRWKPVEDWTIRATYGSSFKAPLLDDLSTIDGGVVAGFVPDIESATGTTLIVGPFGGNPDLDVQTAKSWTMGIDYSPTSIPGLDAKVTYYDVEFDDRIATAAPSVLVPLTQPDVFASVITRDPDEGVVQALIDSPNFLNFSGGPVVPSEVGAIIDQRLQNVAARSVSGVEFEIGYTSELDAGMISFGLRGDHIIEIEDRISPDAESVDRVDTLFNPTDLRVRGSVSWTYRDFDSSLFINYVSDYTNDTAVPETRVDSWTTVDIRLSYTTKRNSASSVLGDLEIALVAMNLLDEDPPQVEATNLASFGYDPSNSNALGRFLALELRKRW